MKKLAHIFIHLLLASILFPSILLGQSSQSQEDSPIEEQIKSLSSDIFDAVISGQSSADSLLEVERVLVEQTTDSFSIATYYCDYALLKYIKGKLNESLEYNLKALEIRNNIADYKGQSKSYSRLAIIYNEQSDYTTAIEYNLKSIEGFKKVGNYKNVGQVYTNISSVYNYLDQADKALEYGDLAVATLDTIDAPYALAGALGNTANAYQKLENYDKAEELLFDSYKIFKAVNSHTDEATALNNLGFNARLQGDNEAGLKYYNLALNLSDSIGDDNGKSNYLANLGNVYYDMENYPLAKEHFIKSLDLSEQHSIRRLMKMGYDGLSKAYTQTKDYQKALDYSKKLINVKDSIYSSDKFDLISKWETKYQTVEKEKLLLEEQTKNETLAIEKAEAELAVSNRNKWIIGLLGGALAILFLSLFILQRNKRIAQSEQDAAIIIERDRGLKAVIEVQEEERKRISKDLHDGIGQQLSGLKMAWQKLSTDIGKANPEEYERLISLTSILDDSAKEVRSISHQMMPKALQDLGLRPALEDMLQKLFDHSDITYSFESHKADARFEESVEISLYRIAQELLNNVIKHSGSSEVSVQLMHIKSKLILIIEDNGSGFDIEESKDGHGLMNIKSRLNTVNGEVNYEPSPGSGTVASIRIPVQ